ncbi:MAG TPA: VapC toxin family PIN domain ribonuclease [Actinophytocola sp.]|uniref:type II toxin-antitoxin system VapC family toxin n=1 Tax=Actinophytocola sp. TaxID=1872138 RepID=UPI002F923DD8
MIICDTGPLVAATLYKDNNHHRCVELFTSLRLNNERILVPTPIIAEVGYLIGRFDPRVEASFLRALAAGDFVPVELTTSDYERMAELVEQYADLPLGTSDAAVVAVAERLKVVEVATLDRRHFTIVRPSHVNTLTLLP